MDANNTKYHFLHGERDWLPILVEQADKDIWWDRERKTISLAPILERVNSLGNNVELIAEHRRGAAFDHYGNIYWISDDRKYIGHQPAVTPFQVGQYWHVDELKQASLSDIEHGDFRPFEKNFKIDTLLLSGLTITTREYMVVGTLQPAGLLVFDMHAGGPPDWLRWPGIIPFSPYDMTCSPDGGVWILDRRETQNSYVVWHLDHNFNVLDDNGNVITLADNFSQDFTAKDVSSTDIEENVCVAQTFYSGLEIGAAGLGIAHNPIAIEALADGAFIILDAPSGNVASIISYFYQGIYKNSVVLDQTVIGELLEQAIISGHDFAFIPDKDSSEYASNGTLFVSASNLFQSFEFILQADADEFILVLQPKLLPMREYFGRALIASAQTTFYDFQENDNLRWFPLTEQPRYRYQSAGRIGGIVMDGDEPDCVWHRIIIDACIPGGTSVIIESRSANDKQVLQDLPWQREPELYLRHNGSELPLHKPFADYQQKPDYMGSWDTLLQNAVGRYIELRITLNGTRRLTPKIRSLRLYYPRFSYMNRYLPDVYREDLISANFLDRFLSNVEGLYTALEDKIASAQTLFDTRTTPPEFLDWLGLWVGALLDPAWDDNRKRLFIDNANLLFRWRGTPLGLWTLIKLTISECPDATLFEPLKQATPDYEHVISGRDVRIVENFLNRGFPGIARDTAQQKTSLVYYSDADVIWEPAQGPGVLHKRFQKYLRDKYKTDLGMQNLNAAWDESYSSIDNILFPAITPEHEIQRMDWRIFTRDFIGFTYAEVTDEHQFLYQDFLARRYQQIKRFNMAYGLTGGQKWSDFTSIPLPEDLPKNIAYLTDWIEFVSLVLPIKRQAHQFIVLLPTLPGELPASMELRRARVEQIVEREKPAHTQFEVQYFWALFQIGTARLGIDTSIGDGGRFVALVLGMNFLGQSYLAESHPWSVVDRSIVGRQRLSASQQPSRPPVE